MIRLPLPPHLPHFTLLLHLPLLPKHHLLPSTFSLLPLTPPHNISTALDSLLSYILNIPSTHPLVPFRYFSTATPESTQTDSYYLCPTCEWQPLSYPLTQDAVNLLRPAPYSNPIIPWWYSQYHPRILWTARSSYYSTPSENFTYPYRLPSSPCNSRMYRITPPRYHPTRLISYFSPSFPPLTTKHPCRHFSTLSYVSTFYTPLLLHPTTTIYTRSFSHSALYS